MYNSSDNPCDSSPGPDNFIVVPVRGWEMAGYGILDGDCLTVDKTKLPSDGEMALVRYSDGEVIASVTYGGTLSILLLSTPYELLVLTPRDNPVIIGKVTRIQH